MYSRIHMRSVTANIVSITTKNMTIAGSVMTIIIRPMPSIVIVEFVTRIDESTGQNRFT